MRFLLSYDHNYNNDLLFAWFYCAAYVLDLQAIFASSTKTRNDQEATLALLTPSRLPISKGYEPSNEAGIAVVTETTETAWRAHALALERDFEALKAKYDEERISASEFHLLW